jgi:hypothetical protein
VRAPARFARAATALAVLAAAGCGSPTAPGRPPLYTAVFVGIPPGADAFLPTVVAAGRVYGVASRGAESWVAVWTEQGGFATVLDAGSGCRAAPRAARAGLVVGEVSCGAPDPGGGPDVRGWIVGAPPPAAPADPHDFSAVSPAGVMGTLFPRAHFPGGVPRAFLLAGSGAEPLVPPGAEASVAGGVADDGTLAVTALSACAAAGCATARVAVRRDGRWTVLPLPNGADRATAVAVSSRGHVLGHAGGPVEHVFVRLGNRTRSLPLIPGTRVVVHGVNALGQVVGTATHPPAPGRLPGAGVLWGRERLYFLSERVAARDWEITSATAIDDEQYVAGTGVHTASGLQGPILLVPGVR